MAARYSARRFFLCLAALLLLAPPLTAQTPVSSTPAVAAAPVRAGLVSDLVPRVRLTRAKIKSDVQVRDPLFLQDLLQTEKKARARLELGEGSIINLGPRTQFAVVEMKPAEQQSLLVLVYGRLRAEVSKRTQPQGHFVVRTRTAIVGAIGTEGFVAAFPEETIVANLSSDPNSLLWVASSDPSLNVIVYVRPGYGTRVPLGYPPTAPRLWGEKELARARDDSREFGRYDANFSRDYPQGFPYAADDYRYSGGAYGGYWDDRSGRGGGEDHGGSSGGGGSSGRRK